MKKLTIVLILIVLLPFVAAVSAQEKEAAELPSAQDSSVTPSLQIEEADKRTETTAIPTAVKQMRKRIRDDQVGMGENLTIAKDEEVGDVVALLGNIALDGSANDVVVIKGTVKLGKDAVIRGDLVSVLGSIVIEEGAVVKGDAVSVLGSISDPGHGVRGTTVQISGPLGFLAPLFAVPGLALLAALKLVTLIGKLLLAYVVIALIPDAIKRVSDQVARSPFISGCVGAGAVVALPFIFILLLITIVGIAIVPLAYFVAFFLGWVAVSQLIGSKLRMALRGNAYRPFLDVTIGMLALALISFIPLFGWIVKWVLALAGLGALILTRFGTREGIGAVVMATPASPPAATQD